MKVDQLPIKLQNWRFAVGDVLEQLLKSDWFKPGDSKLARPDLKNCRLGHIKHQRKAKNTNTKTMKKKTHTHTSTPY